MKDLTHQCSFGERWFFIKVDLSVSMVDGDRFDGGAEERHQTQVLLAHLRAADLDVKAVHRELNMHIRFMTASLKVDVLF